jgi:DNA-3-methyladenine glycosylase
LTHRGRTLPRAFYRRDARDLAPDLLNKLLVRDQPGEPRLAARIVEAEAYCGSQDPASHAFRGMTRRNATMFGPPGHLYVYFTYGMHWCANVVGQVHGDATAVLLRAAAPVQGLALMRVRRPKARADRELCAGPARLCQAFAITGAFDGTDLTRGELRVVDDGTPPPRAPVVTTRIGLRPGEGDESPWRFLVPGDAHISRAPRRVGG